MTRYTMSPRIRFHLQIPIQPIRSVDTSYILHLKVFHFVLPLCDLFKSVSLCYTERDPNVLTPISTIVNMNNVGRMNVLFLPGVRLATDAFEVLVEHIQVLSCILQPVLYELSRPRHYFISENNTSTYHSNWLDSKVSIGHNQRSKTVLRSNILPLNNLLQPTPINSHPDNWDHRLIRMVT